MLDFKAPSSVKAIAALQEGSTRELLLKFGGTLCHSEADAEDLLMDAISRVCDPSDRPWDEARGTFRAHMRVVIRDLARDRRRIGAGRHEVLDEDEVRHARSPGQGSADLLSDAQDLDHLRRRGAILRARLADQPRAVAVFDLTCAGIDAPSEIAERLGCTVEEVYAANRQIIYHASKVPPDEPRSPSPGMPPTRGGAKKEGYP